MGKHVHIFNSHYKQLHLPPPKQRSKLVTGNVFADCQATGSNNDSATTATSCASAPDPPNPPQSLIDQSGGAFHLRIIDLVHGLKMHKLFWHTNGDAYGKLRMSENGVYTF